MELRSRVHKKKTQSPVPVTGSCLPGRLLRVGVRIRGVAHEWPRRHLSQRNLRLSVFQPLFPPHAHLCPVFPWNCRRRRPHLGPSSIISGGQPGSACQNQLSDRTLAAASCDAAGRPRAPGIWWDTHGIRHSAPRAAYIEGTANAQSWGMMHVWTHLETPRKRLEIFENIWKYLKTFGNI